MKLSVQYHISRKTGFVLRAIDRGTQAMSSLCYYIFFNILPILVEFLLICAILIINYNPLLSIISFLVGIIYVIFSIIVTEWRTKYRRKAVFNFFLFNLKNQKS